MYLTEQRFGEIFAVRVGVGTSNFRSYGIEPSKYDIIHDHVSEHSLVFEAKEDGIPKPYPSMKSSEEPATSQVTLCPVRQH